MRTSPNGPDRAIKYRPSVATAIKLWMATAHDMTPEMIDAVVWQEGRHWYVQRDWSSAFVVTPEYRAAHVAAQDDDEYVSAVRKALTDLGWPEVVKGPQLPAPGRRLPGVLRYLGYEPHRNPTERQGRWYFQGKQVRGYRKMR